MRINPDKKGFTIIEALVAMLFLTLAITPAVVVATSVLDVAARIQNDLTGALLAQEGVELVRYLRDYNWLSGCSFNDGLVNGTYIIDIDTEWSGCGNSLSSSGGSAPKLYIDNNGVYSHNSLGAPTRFQRTVTITQISSEELQVISEVYWTPKKGGTFPGCPVDTRCARAESHLYDWR